MIQYNVCNFNRTSFLILFVYLQYVAFEKVAKRLTTEIMGSRKNSENLKHKSIEIQGKLAEAQDKYKQQEKELEDFRRTVGSATAQKESLAVLSKVRQRKPIPKLLNTLGILIYSKRCKIH